ncbi:MAG: hypothetical protein WAU32_04200 [Thermoanaerobaculia bacterium]
MTALALAVGLLVAGIGLVGVVAPQGLQAIAQHVDTPLGIYVAAAVRVAFGLILVRAAPASRSPGVLRVAGVVAIVAGLSTPFVGVDRARAILDWWSRQGPVLMRLGPALALAVGGFITYAVRSGRGEA